MPFRRKESPCSYRLFRTSAHQRYENVCRRILCLVWCARDLRFERILDHRHEKSTISLGDALMSAFAMFSLKDPSLLAFDGRRRDENMKNLYGIETVPSDTRMREILDPVESTALRRLFVDVFRELQRGKALEPFVFYEGHFLLSLIHI